VADYYPARIMARMRNEALPVALRDGLWIGENMVYDSERREVPVEHMIIAHRGADGALAYFSGVMRDISAAKAAEQALRDSESRMRTITDTLPAMVSFVDRDERYRFVNRAYERVFARPRAAILGLSLRELHGEAAYAQIGQYARRALAGETVVFERDGSEMDRLPGTVNGRDAGAATGHAPYRCFETTYIPQMRPAEDGAPARVMGFHVMKQDITARKLEEKRLIQLAHIDSMTGLTNRAGFHLKLAELMAHQDAQAPLLALMYLDIDHFKSVNDTYGHPAGDALLKAFSGRLMRALRDTDVVARLGGDEFTIILPDLRRPEDATAVAAKIVQAMRPPFALGEQTISITTSIGLAFHQGAGTSPEALIQRADEMLYQSKAAGRDTYHVAPLLRIQDGIAA
jgi:diguanylate cyclase (GGDEF)-like protein/PAS domain S-box-containing protein